MFNLVKVKLKFSKLLTIITPTTTVIITMVSGILFPSTLLKFSSLLTKSRLACMQSIYSSWDILIFGVPSLRYCNSFAK